MDEPLFDYVMRELRSCRKPLRIVAEEAGVPYFTVQKWKRVRGTRNPRVDTVQKLADYFRRQGHMADTAEPTSAVS